MPLDEVATGISIGGVDQTWDSPNLVESDLDSFLYSLTSVHVRIVGDIFMEKMNENDRTNRIHRL